MTLYIALPAGEPNNDTAQNGEHCVMMKSGDQGWNGTDTTNTYWMDVPCCSNHLYSVNTVVCEKRKSAQYQTLKVENRLLGQNICI